MRRFAIVSAVLLGMLLIGLSPLSAAIISYDATVESRSNPWSVSLNSAYPYGSSGSLGPTVIDYAMSGISFAEGNSITIEYLSGTTRAGGAFGFHDADGDPGYPTKYYSAGAWVDAAGSSGLYFPTRHLDDPEDTTTAYYLNALVGTFADAGGVIVGTPFFIGASELAVLVPSGAWQLQLGINDDAFGDNTGSLLVKVSGSEPAVPETPTGVPEPAILLLLGLGILGLAETGRRMRP